jgi:tRNA-2-methylthio-N6-dimethylallyladenosine synthase
LVHFSTGDARPRPGDIITTEITYAAPHHLNADQPPLSHRRTKAGDLHEAGKAPRTGGVLLGLPTIGAPASAEPADACAR